MTNKTYAEKLKDPRWQKFRLMIFERDNWECLRCDCKIKQLHVHHLNYVKNKNPWNYKYDEVATLCEDCHASIHNGTIEKEDVFKEIRRLPLSFYEELRMFNKFIIEASHLKNITGLIDAEKYFRYLRTFFIDTDYNFPTLRNAIKRIEVDFLPIKSTAERIYNDTDEHIRYLFNYLFEFKRNDFESIDMENLLGIIFGRMKLSCLYEDCINELNSYETIFNIQAYLTYKHYGIGSKNVAEAVTGFDSICCKNVYLYDLNKWIEKFDCIEWEPIGVQS